MLEHTPPNTTEVLVHRMNRTLSTPELVDWAVGALESHHISASVQVLASLCREQPVADALPYLDRALRELNIDVPDPEVLLRRYGRQIAAQLLAGELDVQAALELMHRHVVGPLHHPRDLQAWCYLADDLDPDGIPGLDPSKIHELARAQARQLIEADG